MRRFDQSVPVAARCLEGHTYLYLTGMAPTSLGVYRRETDSHTFQPVGIVMTDPGNRTYRAWPKHPSENPWVWVDANNDGQLQDDEFEHAPRLRNSSGWFVDDTGEYVVSVEVNLLGRVLPYRLNL